MELSYPYAMYVHSTPEKLSCKTTKQINKWNTTANMVSKLCAKKYDFNDTQNTKH